MLTQFSTHLMPAPHRKKMWTEQMAEFCGPFDVEFAPGDFSGRVDVWKTGQYACARVRQNARSVRRVERDLVLTNTDFFYLVMQTSGQSTYSQEDSQAVLKPGEMTLIDAARSSAIHFDSGHGVDPKN